MQWKFLLTSFFALIITLLFSCGKKQDVAPEYDEYPYGNSDVTTIQLNGSPVVTLRQDTCNRIIRQTKGMQVSKLGSYLIVNGGGELVVGCRNSLGISLNGGGVRNLDSAILMKQLTISGQNGQVYLTKMTVENSIAVGVTNTGDWQIKGTTPYLTVSTTAYGRFFGFDLLVDSCVVSHTGLGDVQVNVSQKLTGGVYSIGNLFYKGHPAIVNVSAPGMGKAIEQ
jgi:hypothetical protein